LESLTAVWIPGDHDRLMSLLDVLTGVRMNLTPLRDGTQVSPALEPSVMIAEACALLHTAMADLRNVILRLDETVSPQTRQVAAPAPKRTRIESTSRGISPRNLQA
jgi:hypothetical protein